MPHDLMHQYGMFYTKAIADTHLAKLAISSGYKDIDDATILKLSSVCWKNCGFFGNLASFPLNL